MANNNADDRLHEHAHHIFSDFSVGNKNRTTNAIVVITSMSFSTYYPSNKDASLCTGIFVPTKIKDEGDNLIIKLHAIL